MSGGLVSGYTEDESCISKTTWTRMLLMACETLKFYRPIVVVILKMHLISDDQIKVKVYENEHIGCTDFFTLIISFVFSS